MGPKRAPSHLCGSLGPEFEVIHTKLKVCFSWQIRWLSELKNWVSFERRKYVLNASSIGGFRIPFLQGSKQAGGVGAESLVLGVLG